MPFSVTGSLGKVSIGREEYTQLKALGDNSCLFHSVGYLLERAGKNEPAPGNAATLRNLTCDRIALLLTSEATDREVQDRCRQHVYGVAGVGEREEREKAAALTSYVRGMRSEDAWGDLLCVYALELIYGVRIAVYHIGHSGATARANFPNPSGEPTLHIVTPYTGVAGVYNHYNPLVLVPTAEEKVPAADGREEALADPKQWEYWSRKKLFLFNPASCHSQYSDLWTAPPAPRRAVLAVSNTSDHVISAAVPTVASVALHSEVLKLTSASFRADLPAASLKVAVEEPFQVLLARDESGRATPALDCRGVTVELHLTLFEQVRKVNFDVFTRVNGTPVAKGELQREALEKLAKGRAGDQVLQIPLGEIFSAEELSKLTYSGSPFRLVACTNGSARETEAIKTTQWAFTYFHVPDAWDINTVEGVQASRIIPLQDSLTALRTVEGATVRKRSAENDAAVKSPPGLGPNNEKISSFLASLADPENPAYIAANHNIFWQLEDESYYVATSWASILILTRDGDNGYLGHSLLIHGSPKVYLATSDAQEKSESLGDKRLTLLKTLSEKVSTLRSKLQIHPTSFFSSDHEEVVAAKNSERLAVQAIENDKETLDYLKHQQRLKILSDKENPTTRLDLIRQVLPPLESTVRYHASELAEKVRLRSVSGFDGENDFEGFRPGTKGGWNQYFLPPGMRISKAITQGISSCAGGATFTDEDVPEFIILWHIDFPPWVPIKQIIQQLKPNLKECPALRTVGMVYPDCAELNKYRPAMIYPEEVRAKSKTVFLTRGDHLGVEDFSLGSGSEYFGLDLSDPRRPDVVFTHDINKRTEMVSKRKQKSSDEDVSITLHAFHQNVFGAYRYSDIAVVDHDLDAMRRYTMTVATTDNDSVKRDKLGKCHVVRLQGVGRRLFEALDRVAMPVMETPSFLLGLRVEQEFGEATPEVQAGRAWRTGHQERKPADKKKVE